MRPSDLNGSFVRQMAKLYELRILALEEQIRLKDARIEVLYFDLERLKEVLAAPRPQPSATPLWVSEHEEDITFAREHQAISIAEAEDMLRELQFDNPDIEIDESMSDVSLY